MTRVVLIVCSCVKGRQERKKVLENVVQLATYTYLSSMERDDDDDDYRMMMTILDVTAPKVHLPTSLPHV